MLDSRMEPRQENGYRRSEKGLADVGITGVVPVAWVVGEPGLVRREHRQQEGRSSRVGVSVFGVRCSGFRVQVPPKVCPQKRSAR